MWILVSLTTIAASLWLVMRQIRIFGDDLPSRAVILLIWSRFALTALGEPALRPVAAGQSLLALGTLTIVMGVVMILPLSQLRMPRLLPFFAMAGVAVLSGILNGQANALVNTVTLWTMFTVIALLIYRAYARHGLRSVLDCLLAVFVLPIGLQLLSILLGRSMVGQDGTVAYVGNYAHEAVFATVALCAAWLVALYPWRKKSWLAAAFVLVLGSMLMANYRTLILACLPLLVAVSLRFGWSSGQAKQRLLPILVGAIILIVALPLLPIDRFAELGVVADSIGGLIKPAQEFSAAEKDILSSRIYIGAAYIERYGEGGLLRHLIGFGPAADTGFIGTHPHNEFLRVLFETGLLGLLLWLGILAHLTIASLKYAPRPANALLTAGYGALIIGSLGTSFFIRPEGIILVAVMAATTWHLTENASPVPARGAPAPAPEAG